MLKEVFQAEDDNQRFKSTQKNEEDWKNVKQKSVIAQTDLQIHKLRVITSHQVK